MTTPAVQYRALVVDDEPLVRHALARALRSENFVCESAANGREALEWVGEFRYDLVVTDVRMPEHNGHALAVDLLALPHRPVIIVLTGVLEPRIANDLRMRGVDEVLFKPIDFQFLAKRARALVEAREDEGASEDAASRGSDAGEEAADGVTGPAEAPIAVHSAGTASEEPPLRYAALPLRARASAAHPAEQRSELANDQHTRLSQLSETAESLRVPARAMSDLGQRPAAPITQIQNGADPSASRGPANHFLVADHAHDSVARRIGALADQLGTPSESYDGFAIASRSALCIPVLADAVLRNPALIHDVLRMANGVLYGMSRVLREAQGSATAPQHGVTQQPAAQQPAAQHQLTMVIIFALGIGLGWLLSWVSPAAWLR